jgi:hypothetical protein
VVAIASPVATDVPDARRRGSRWRWSAATGIVLLVGLGLRLAFDAGGVGDRSAAVMTALLGLSAWAAASMLGTPRTAFVVTLGLMALLDLAALPARTATEYDDRQAFYRTDQVLVAQVPIAPTLLQTQTSPLLTLLVEPIFAGAQPQFDLAGEIGATQLTWDCAFRHGIQRLTLPVPTALLVGGATLDIRLHLTGSPTRESDYMVLYTSSARGGFLVFLVADAEGATICR